MKKRYMAGEEMEEGGKYGRQAHEEPWEEGMKWVEKACGEEAVAGMRRKAYMSMGT